MPTIPETQGVSNHLIYVSHKHKDSVRDFNMMSREQLYTTLIFLSAPYIQQLPPTSLATYD